MVLAGLNNSTLTVEVLIGYGADISAQDNTLIKDAVFYGKIDLFNLCCDYGKDIKLLKNELLELCEIQSTENKTDEKNIIKGIIAQLF